MNNFAKRLLLPVIASSLLISGAALAMGGDGSGQTTPTCPKGQIYDTKTKTCMVDKSSMINDNDHSLAL